MQAASKRLLKPNKYRYWTTVENQKEFLLQVAKKLNITKFDDWYSVQLKDVTKHGGYRLLALFQNSIPKMVQSVFPEFKWTFHKFHTVPRHYWDNIDNQRKFLEDIAEKLKIKTMEDWYKITPKQLEIACAPYPFRRTSGNLVPMLLRVYSEYPWHPWRFTYLPKNYWDDEENIMKAMGWAAKELGITEVHDWNNVSKQQLNTLGLLSLVSKFGSMQNLFMFCFPDFNEGPLRKPTSKLQLRIQEYVMQIFPGVEVHANCDALSIDKKEIPKSKPKPKKVAIPTQNMKEAHFFHSAKFFAWNTTRSRPKAL